MSKEDDQGGKREGGKREGVGERGMGKGRGSGKMKRENTHPSAFCRYCVISA